MIKVILFLTFLCMFNFSNLFAQKDLNQISVVLTKANDELLIVQNIQLTFSIQNNASKKQQICPFFTPIEGFKGNFLIVNNEAGEEIEYTGIKMKRTKPSKDKLVTINAKQVLKQTFNLSDNYKIPKPGLYTIQFIGNKYINKLPDSKILEIKVQ